MPQTKKTAPKKEERPKTKNGFYYDFNGMVKENYLIGLDTAHSLLEENKRFFEAQIEQMTKIQQDYTENVKSIFDKLPGEYTSLGLSEKLERIIEFQNNFYSTFKKVSDSYSKELLDLNQKSAERAFSAFDKYVGSFTS